MFDKYKVLGILLIFWVNLIFAVSEIRFSPEHQSPEDVYQIVRDAINYSREDRDQLLDAAEQYAQAKGDVVLQNKLMRSRSVNCIIGGDAKKGLEWARKALDHANSQQLSKEEIVHTLGILGQAFSSNGDYVRALKIYNESSLMADKLGNKDIFFTSKLMEANLYIRLQKTDQALEVMREMAPCFDNCSNDAHKLLYTFNYVDCLYTRERYDEIIQFVDQKLGFENTDGDVMRINIRLIYVMSVLNLDGNWDADKGALDGILQDIESELEDYSPSRDLFVDWMYLGRTWLTVNNYGKADHATKKARAMLEGANDAGLLRNLTQLEAHVAYGLGDYQKAWQTILTHIDLDHQLSDTSTLEQIEFLRAENDSKLKNAEIERLNLENRLNLRTLRFQHWVIILFVAMIVLLAVFSAMGFALWQKERFLRDELVDANAKLKEAEANKDYFLAITSHELRNPLNGIIGVISMLKTMDLGKDASDLCNLASESSEGMLLQINEILDYAKSESGTIELSEKLFNVRDLVSSVAGLFEPKARILDLQLLFDVSPDVPEQVLGDAFRIRQILSNFISNALKFTQVGSIEIQVKIDGNLIVYAVSDTGVGLTDEEISRLFHPFQQASSEIERVYGGTGLGLSICSKLVKLMDGTISVRSRKGMGSHFSFALPLSRNPDV